MIETADSVYCLSRCENGRCQLVKVGKKKVSKRGIRTAAARYAVGTTFRGYEIVISDAGIRMRDYDRESFVTGDVRKVSGFTLRGENFTVDMRYDGRRKKWIIGSAGGGERADKELLLASRGIITYDANYSPAFILNGDYVLTSKKE